VGGMARHMRSLRTLDRDHGWIHNLLEEAENERMHLFFFLRLRKPGFIFRSLIMLGQGIFFNLYFITYLFAPKYSHRFVGYLEEEAVHTYTVLIK
jgi:threonyl-tRNA synthetase